MVTPLVLEACIDRCMFCAEAGVEAGGGVKNEEVAHSSRGSPGMVSSGIARSKLSAKACRVNEAIAVHRRRADWSQVLSTESNMWSSRTGPLPVQTPEARDLIQNNAGAFNIEPAMKKTAWARGLGKLARTNLDPAVIVSAELWSPASPQAWCR